VSPGTLITIEGLDGAGKSTLAAALQQHLAQRGVAVELLREPGGVQLSERIRQLVKDPALPVHPRAEALLYAAARAQLVEQSLRPLLAQGRVVLLDRFVDSSLAYQGAGRSLGIEQIRQLNMFATGGLTAQRTLLLRVSTQQGLRRRQSRPGTADRLEQEQQSFFAAIAAAYEQLALAEPQRIRVLDASLPAEDVLAQALSALDDLHLARPAPPPRSRPAPGPGPEPGPQPGRGPGPGPAADPGPV
jgi:dTMP kinase